jgi:hypothetical protein
MLIAGMTFPSARAWAPPPPILDDFSIFKQASDGSSFRGGYSRKGDLDADGTRVSVAGPLGCRPKQGSPRLVYRLTLSQPQSGALARGRWAGTCTRNGRWHATLRVVNRALRPGDALGCGLATATRAGKVIAAAQWCDRLPLVR